MADRPKSVNKVASGLTQLGDLYVQGDQLPVPDVEEKNTDSVWALWSDLVDENPKAGQAGDENEAGREQDFLETIPLDLNAMPETQWMDLPELPQK